MSVTSINEGHDRSFQTNYEGVIPNLQRRYRETTSDYIRSEIERYMTSRPCPTCGGKRLRPEALAVTVTDRNIDEVSHLSVTAAVRWIERLAGIGAMAKAEAMRGERARSTISTPESPHCQSALPSRCRPARRSASATGPSPTRS